MLMIPRKYGKFEAFILFPLAWTRLIRRILLFFYKDCIKAFGLIVHFIPKRFIHFFRFLHWSQGFVH